MQIRRLCRFPLLLSCLIPSFCDAAGAPASGAEGIRQIPAISAPRVAGLEKFQLYQHPSGHILCLDEETATRMAAALERTMTAFKTSFGKTPGPGLYHQDLPEAATVAARLGPALRSAWIAPAAESKSTERSLGPADWEALKAEFRAQTKAQYPNMSDESFEQAFARARPDLLAQVQGSRVFGKTVRSIDTAPLARRLLTAAFWPAAPASRHGAPCADWLDEAAAMRAATDADIESSRERIRAMAGTEYRELHPLDQFTAMSIPGPDDAVELFRAQAATFADFLVETSGKPAILGEIASAAAVGRSFSSWLALSGTSNGLGGSMARLEKAYHAWLKETQAGEKPGAAIPAVGAPGVLKAGAKLTPEAIAAADFIQGAAPMQWEPDKVYFIECWATWCAPCVQTIPHVNELHKAFADRGLRVVGMNVMEDDRAAVVDFVKARGEGMTYPVAFVSKRGRFQTEWLAPSGVNSIPHVYVVRNGELLFHCHPAMITRKMVETLLAGGPQADALVKNMRARTK